MSVGVSTYECEGCGADVECRSQYAFNPESGKVEQKFSSDFEECQFCDGRFCVTGCFEQHDCPGHPATEVMCQYCGESVPIATAVKDKFGDAFCPKCWKDKPWETPTQKKEA